MKGPSKLISFPPSHGHPIQSRRPSPLPRLKKTGVSDYNRVRDASAGAISRDVAWKHRQESRPCAMGRTRRACAIAGRAGARSCPCAGCKSECQGRLRWRAFRLGLSGARDETTRPWCSLPKHEGRPGTGDSPRAVFGQKEVWAQWKVRWRATGAYRGISSTVHYLVPCLMRSWKDLWDDLARLFKPWVLRQLIIRPIVSNISHKRSLEITVYVRREPYRKRSNGMHRSRPSAS